MEGFYLLPLQIYIGMQKISKRLSSNLSWWEKIFLNKEKAHQRIVDGFELENLRKHRDKTEDDRRYARYQQQVGAIENAEEHIDELKNKGEWDSKCQTGKICTGQNHNPEWPTQLPDSMFLQNMDICFKCYRKSEKFKKEEAWANKYSNI